MDYKNNKFKDKKTKEYEETEALSCPERAERI